LSPTVNIDARDTGTPSYDKVIVIHTLNGICSTRLNDRLGV
jgi:hypothetical protein